MATTPQRVLYWGSGSAPAWRVMITLAEKQLVRIKMGEMIRWRFFETIDDVCRLTFSTSSLILPPPPLPRLSSCCCTSFSPRLPLYKNQNKTAVRSQTHRVFEAGAQDRPRNQKAQPAPADPYLPRRRDRSERIFSGGALPRLDLP